MVHLSSCVEVAAEPEPTKHACSCSPARGFVYSEWASWYNLSLYSPRSTTRHSSLCPKKIWKKLVSLPLEPDARCYLQSQVRNCRPTTCSSSAQLLLYVCIIYWSHSVSDPDLNKSRRRLSDTPAVKPSYLEGGASGRLLRIMDVDAAAQSNHWWNAAPDPRRGHLLVIRWWCCQLISLTRNLQRKHKWAAKIMQIFKLCTFFLKQQPKAYFYATHEKPKTTRRSTIFAGV